MISRVRTNSEIKVRFYCDNCGWRIAARQDGLFQNDDFWDPENAEQHLCDDCHEAIWRDLLKDCCPRCHSQPCEHGRDCWINPFPKIMNLCHVAERIGPYHPGLLRGLRLLDEYLEGAVSCIDNPNEVAP